MKWFYFYTPDYAFWHEHLSHVLAAQFDLQPIAIRRNELSLNAGAGHHFTGVRRKLELVHDCVKRCRGETIVFSDCTQFVHEGRVEALRDYLDEPDFRDHDLVFPRDGPNDAVNIGLIRMRCNWRTVLFWRRCLRRMRPHSWDQRIVNKKLAQSGRFAPFARVRHRRFDEGRIVCGPELLPAYRDTFYVFKQFIDPKDETHNWNSRLQGLHRAGLIDGSVLERNVR